MAGNDLTELSSRRLADFVNKQTKTGETTAPDRLLRFNGIYGRGRVGAPARPGSGGRVAGLRPGDPPFAVRRHYRG